MIKNKLFEDRLAYYRKKLRIQKIENVRAQTRKQLINRYTLQQIPDLLHPKCISQSQQLDPISLFFNCRATLINPLNSNIPNKADHISIQNHVAFWQHYLSFLSHNMTLCYNVFSHLAQFLSDLLENNLWSSFMAYPQYKALIIELIELVFGDLEDYQKRQLAQWIIDLEYIEVVLRLSQSAEYFPSPQQFPSLYSLINQGLQSQTPTSQSKVALVVLNIIKYANSSHMKLLIISQPLMLPQILALLNQHALTTEAINFWPPLLYLSQFWPQKQIINQITRVSTLMLKSGHDSNIFGALNLLNLTLNYNQQHFSMVVEEQVEWLKVCFDKQIYLNSQKDNLKLFFDVLNSAFVNSKQLQTINIVRNCHISQHELLEMFLSIWELFECDSQLVCSNLGCFLGFMGCCGFNQIHFSISMVLNVIKTKNLIAFIQKYSQSTNPNISDIAISILQRLDEWDHKFMLEESL